MSGHVVLGAGVAGLAVAHRARELGTEVTLYEASATAGGLLDSFTVDGWRFDNGVHLSFASEPEVRAVFDRTPYAEHEAASLNWDDGRWLKHPVQNNMFPLPAEERTALIADFVARPELEVRTYRDWLIHQYGHAIAERWPLVYTRKYWTVDAGELGLDWIGNRMRRADVREVLFGAMSPEAPSTYYISRMRYPVRGGYRAFIEPLIEGADIRTGHRATALDWRARRIRFANGEEVAYDGLVSTIPLPVLIDIMTEVPDEVRAAAASLFASQVDLISIGIARPDVSPSLWFYIYDTDIMAARVYSPSWKSAANAPAGHSSLQFEIYSSPRNPQTATPEEMKENCLAALETMGLARRDEVVLLHHKTLPYGNVVFDLGMEARRDLVVDWVRGCGIELAGRFGEWAYLWSNQSFMSGRRAAEAMLRASDASS
ncbi:FAD-dependent oxidoreductase [Pararoseomonas sp. SCSIO 73927]|uniref:protoporphyrinogen/coproporphyrinogen oxidase n=1 Tax=Pararoseomonas sp. SCSIO 73927 TaxID=3114537 RepID=UPI0030CFA6BD